MFIANLNPFRYRGYYYDIETGLYYLNSRYYDPQTGRFINADSLDNIDTDNLNGLNLYVYCGNNPIMNIDPNGKFFLSFLVGLFIASVTVAVVNTGVQLASDVINYAMTGQWNSSWEDYAGAFLGGLVGGATFFLTGGNMVATFGIMNGIQDLTTSIFTNLTGKTNYSYGEIMRNTLISAGISAMMSGLFSGLKIPNITKGINSYIAVWKSGLTKLFNGTANKMSCKVILKGLVGFTALKGITGAIGDGIIKTISDWFDFLWYNNRKGVGYA